MEGPDEVRVAFVIPDMLIGGAEKIALVLIREFRRLGHSVDLVVARRTGALLDLLPEGVEIVDLEARRFRWMFFPLTRYFRRRQPDATLVFMWPLNVIALITHLLSRSNGRIIVSDHNTLSKEFAGRSQWFLKMLELSIRWLYPFAHARVLVSREAANDLAALSGLDRNSLTVIANPIDTLQIEAGTLDAARSWRGSGARILTVGRLKPQKNHRLLLDAFAKVVRQRPAQLIILGDGDLKRQLARQAESLGIADQLILAGALSNPWPVYRSADLFVLSSDYEGFGNVLVEAMIAGVPIVSTDCLSGPSEILDGGRFGRLVPVGDAQALADAMIEALDEPKDSERLKRRAEEVSGDSINRYVELMISNSYASTGR